MLPNRRSLVRLPPPPPNSLGNRQINGRFPPPNAIERTDTPSRDHDLKITPLRDDVPPRSRGGIDGDRVHGLTLPERRDRQEVLDQSRIYHPRGSEVELLERAAQYRVTFTEDLKQDAGDANRSRRLALKEQGLIEERSQAE